MIKQLCINIWMENKRNPKGLLWKLFCIAFTIFGGAYSFIFAILSNNHRNEGVSFQEKCMERIIQPEITYFIPSSFYRMKQYEIVKCTVLALFYGCITIVGYLITIQRQRYLDFDKEMVLFLCWMLLYVFLVVFIMKLHNTIAVYLNVEYMYLHLHFSKGMRAIHFCGYILTSVVTIIFTFFRFGLDYSLFSDIRLMSCGIIVGVALIGIVFLLLDIRYSLKRFIIGDYRS